MNLSSLTFIVSQNFLLNNARLRNPLSILIIGADTLGNIDKKLYQFGFKKILHIKGRKTADVKLKIPKEVKLILVLTDYINHNLAKKIKTKAKENAIPILFSKRAWSSIESNLTEKVLIS